MTTREGRLALNLVRQVPRRQPFLTPGNVSSRRAAAQGPAPLFSTLRWYRHKESKLMLTYHA